MPKLKSRFVKIFGLSLVISIVTYFLFPDRWIYFGTLHCIAFCSLAVVPFTKKQEWAFNTGLFIVFSNLFVPKDILPLSQFFSVKSMDYIPFYPWVGVSLMGITLVKKDYHKMRIKEFFLTEGLAYLGRHALIIYLVHQPLIYGTCLLLKKLNS